jgi:hypothetical protein
LLATGPILGEMVRFVVLALAVGGCGRLGFDVDASGADGTTITGRHWSQRDDSAPGQLFAPRLAYDSARRTVLLYGGDLGIGARPANASAAMWELSSTGWQRVCDPCPPGPRLGHAFAYDPVRDRVVLYGGTSTGPTLSDLWEWDGTAWANVAPPGPSPGARMYPQMTFDLDRKRLVMLGGLVGGSLTADIYEYDGTWYHPTPAPGPSSVAGQGTEIAFETTYHRVVVLEDTHRQAADADAVWTWDGASWGLLCTTCTQQLRTSGSLFYDPATTSLFITGGFDDLATHSIDGTWQLTQTWTRSSLLPPARDSSGIAYDAVRSVFVMYGGNGGGCVAMANCDETWEFVPD